MQLRLFSNEADFFVHPDYHRLVGREVTAEIEQYEAALHEQIEASRLPILIHDPDPTVERGNFWDIFPAEQRFPTDHSLGSLMPEPEVATRLQELLDEHAVIEAIVHGSYLGRCVKMFKESLRASASNDRLYYSPRWWEKEVSEDIDCPDTVKYGVVLLDHVANKPSDHFEESDYTQVFCTSRTGDLLVANK